MRRREFIKKAGLTAAGALVFPYVLPGGRLFAASGSRIANHVVLCLFAGGVRNFESMHKAEGNLMPYTLNGNESINSSITPGMSPLPAPPGTRLQSFGTLFKEFRYAQGYTGHFSGHSTAITGKYVLADLNIRQRPESPTVFEYYRRHNSPSMSALNAWWISNALGPFPSLNFSNYPGYGALYGANYIQPASIISQAGYDALGQGKVYSSSDIEIAKNLRGFFDKNFSSQFSAGDAGVINSETDSVLIDNFINKSFSEATSGLYNDPWGVGASMNNDMFNVFFAEKLIQQFKPELLVVNMQEVDTAHSSFTQYCNNIRKADYALAHLWNTIQSTPGMANDTVMIAVPEHGRNLQPNTVIDSNGRFALDHNNDPTSREIFCLVLGPPGKVKQNQVINTTMGESIDLVPTIAKVLGFNNDIPSGMLTGTTLDAAFI